MFDFDPDEFIFMLAAMGVGAFGAWRWYRDLLSVSPLLISGSGKALLGLTPLASLFVLFVIIQIWADPVHVAGHADYTLLFLCGGAVWIFLTPEVFSVAGISAGDDAMHRRNPAAVIAVAGGMFAVMLTYAGSNAGNGPTIWTTLIPAFVATLALLAAWVVLEMLGGASEAIALDHDRAAAVRLAVFLICAGAIFGRAMAGDWSDWPSTFSDFFMLSLPVPLLLIPLAAGMNRLLGPSPDRPHPSLALCGVIPAGFLVLITFIYMVLLGPPYVAPPGEYNL